MFNMKVVEQKNIEDRTLLLGIPDYDVIPEEISDDSNKYKVIGLSVGVKAPYVSLEIESTKDELKGKIVSN